MVGIVAYGLFAENASLWVPGVVSDPGGMRVSWADPGLVLTELTNKQAGTAQCWESEGRRSGLSEIPKHHPGGLVLSRCSLDRGEYGTQTQAHI